MQYKHKNKVYKPVTIARSKVSNFIKENPNNLSNNINHWSTADPALNEWRKLLSSGSVGLDGSLAETPKVSALTWPASNMGGWIVVNLFFTFFFESLSLVPLLPQIFYGSNGDQTQLIVNLEKMCKEVLIVSVKSENYSCLLLETEYFDTEE